MTKLGTAAPQFKQNLFDAATQLWANEADPVQVIYGLPAWDRIPDTVSFGAVTGQQEFATFGTNRTREELVTLEVIFYCFRGGGQEQEQITTDRAAYLLQGLSEYVRVTDPTVGGSVRVARLTDYAQDQATDPTVFNLGRMAVLSATFTGQARITS